MKTDNRLAIYGALLLALCLIGYALIAPLATIGWSLWLAYRLWKENQSRE